MSLPQTTGGYGLGPGEGEPLWFNGGLGLLKATGDQTEGRFAALELLAPKGFASPLHIHREEDEFFVVLSGEVRVKHGDVVIEAVAGSLVYGPRNVPMRSMSIRRKLASSCSSDRLALKGFSAKVGNRPEPSIYHPLVSSSSTNMPSVKSAVAITRSLLVRRCRRRVDQDSLRGIGEIPDKPVDWLAGRRGDRVIPG